MFRQVWSGLDFCRRLKVLYPFDGTSKIYSRKVENLEKGEKR